MNSNALLEWKPKYYTVKILHYKLKSCRDAPGWMNDFEDEVISGKCKCWSVNSPTPALSRILGTFNMLRWQNISSSLKFYLQQVRKKAVTTILLLCLVLTLGKVNGPSERSQQFWRDRKHTSRPKHLEDTRVPAAAAELSGPPALGSVGLSPGPESPAAVGPVVSARTARRLFLWQSAAAHRAPPAELPGCCSPEIPPEDTGTGTGEWMKGVMLKHDAFIHYSTILHIFDATVWLWEKCDQTTWSEIPILWTNLKEVIYIRTMISTSDSSESQFLYCSL